MTFICTFPQIPQLLICTFHLRCRTFPLIVRLVCSSEQLHSSLEGEQEYLLLEECESKPLSPQTSL